MRNILEDVIVEAGAVMDKISENNMTPDNKNTNELDISNSDKTLLIVLICLILLLIAIAFIIFYKKQVDIYKLEKLLDNKVNNDESSMVLKYRELTENEKKIVKKTISNLKSNHKTNSNLNSNEEQN